MSADRIAMLEIMCAHRDAQIVKLRMDRAEIQDEIEQLKGLVNRNADLSKANIRLLEENTEFRKSIDLLQDQIADLLHAIRNVSAASLKN